MPPQPGGLERRSGHIRSTLGSNGDFPSATVTEKIDLEIRPVGDLVPEVGVSDRLPVDAEICGPPSSSHGSSFRFVARRRVGRNADDSDRQDPSPAYLPRKAKAESTDFQELLNTLRIRSRRSSEKAIATVRGRRDAKNGVDIVEIGRKLTELC